MSESHVFRAFSLYSGHNQTAFTWLHSHAAGSYLSGAFPVVLRFTSHDFRTSDPGDAANPVSAVRATDVMFNSGDRQVQNQLVT